MPVYNNGPYIASAIQSVLNQTYSAWELIIVDDASTDDTAKIIQSALKLDSRISARTLPENSRGAARPRNVAMKFAMGRYVAFLDGDDIWLPEKLERQISFMQKSGAAISCTAFRVMTPDGTPTSRVLSAPEVVTLPAYLKKTNIGLSTSVIDREKIGNFRFNEQVAVEDFELWTRLLKDHNAYCLDSELVHYRRGHKSLSSNKLRAAFNQLGSYYQLRKQIGALPAATAFVSYAISAIRKRL